MEYNTLSVFKYNGSGPSRSDAEVFNEYQRRLDGFATVITNLHPNLDKDEYEQGSEYPIFFVQTNKINTLLNESQRLSHQINEVATKLPGVAKDSYTRRLLTQEIFFTNEIEGVKTSREEIGTLVSELDSNSKQTKRLSSTVKLYNDTISGKSYQITELSDFRKIYDELLKGEISSDNLPDGKLFRNSKETYIGSANRIVHIPPRNEKEIEERLTPLISFMNSHETMDIIKAIVTHFMFENVHPFYDGNGRTGRYLLSSYLANKLDTFTGLSISGAIHAEQSGYYKVFKEADAFENKADVTLFITKMLEIITNGQTEVLQDLEKLSQSLEQAHANIAHRFDDTVDRTVLFLFAQSSLFSQNLETGIKDTELVNALHQSDQKTYKKTAIRNSIKKLEGEGVLRSVKIKPAQHVIDSSLLE